MCIYTYILIMSEQQITASLLASDTPRKRSSQQAKFIVATTSKQPAMRFMPTYRMQPSKPLNKEVCEKIIKTVMDKTFEEFTYLPKSSMKLCSEVSEEIKNQIKNLHYDRYRYIVVVSIGEKLMQGFVSLVNFLWDEEHDGYLSYVIETPKFFATATLYFIYFD